MVSTPTDAKTKPDQCPSDCSAEATRTREILVVARDPEQRVFLNKALYLGGLSSTFVSSGAEAFACMRGGSYGILVVGLDSPESIDLLGRVHREFPETPVLAVSRTATPDLVRDVLRTGATDFWFGPMDTRAFGPKLLALMGSRQEPEGPQGAGSAPAQPREVEAREARKASPEEYKIICRSKRMQRILEIAETIAPTESTALIQGESGTGKELIAKKIHSLSKRQDKPFVEVNCGALPPNLLESQLFGHEKGSFTGAVGRQAGLFEIADQGTIFLDEIGEMSLDMQVKLLRVLQFKEFRRIGGSQVVKVDVRVIAATNKDLKLEVQEKRFRPDLFYRLNVISLLVPPLRERAEEIPDLIETFCEKFARERSAPRRTFTLAAVEKMQKCRWTGNVRELENAVERALLLSRKDVVDAEDLDEYLGESAEPSMVSAFDPTLTLDEVKRIHITSVLQKHGGNKMRTARILKINVKTLYNLMRRLDIKA